MNRVLAIIGGVGAGVAAAYFLDPKKGADRRAMVVDKFNTLKHDATQKISDAAESLRQQADGTVRDTAMIGEGGSRGDSKLHQAGKQSQSAVH